MGIEYELKFRANVQALASIREKYAGQPQTHYDMETTYYDTPSGALSARHYTLRKRMENQTSICTLKTPVKQIGRMETEVECDNILSAIPMLCEAGAPADFSSLVQEGLCAVCGAKFHRIAITLTLEDCVVELALDSGILTGGGKTIPLYEVEVELKDGDPFSVDLFAKMLAIEYRLAPETKSKFRRALALANS